MYYLQCRISLYCHSLKNHTVYIPHVTTIQNKTGVPKNMFMSEEDDSKIQFFPKLCACI